VQPVNCKYILQTVGQQLKEVLKKHNWYAKKEDKNRNKEQGQ